MERTFKIFIPANQKESAQFVKEIKVETFIDEDGDEILTSESLDFIDKEQKAFIFQKP